MAGNSATALYTTMATVALWRRAVVAQGTVKEAGGDQGETGTAPRRRSNDSTVGGTGAPRPLGRALEVVVDGVGRDAPLPPVLRPGEFAARSRLGTCGAANTPAVNCSGALSDESRGVFARA